MRVIVPLQTLIVCLLGPWMLIAAAPAALAQSPSSQTDNDAGTASDDTLTIVVGTRFVGPSATGETANTQFTDARIPLTAFNETDHCVDQSALETATAYFNSLGRVLSQAGHFYFVPEADVREAVSMCEKMHGRPPQAWVADQTAIIEYGKVVPAAEASALEQSIR